VLLFALSISALAHSQSYSTTVQPRPGENFAEPCHYDMTLPAPHRTIRAVWVTFDRGRDIMKFYSDPEVVAFARRHSLALMMPRQCFAKDAPGVPPEMDMDPSHGVGRALFTALEQFAQQTDHPELSSAKLILLGFSGTGALFSHFVGYAPARVVGAVLAGPGHYDPVGMDNVRLSSSAIGVPELIIVGGSDKVSGTQRPYDYFRRYWEDGAPWTFLVQNKTPHCCVINTKFLMLDWLDQIIKLRKPSSEKPLRTINDHHGWLGFIRTCPSDVHDSWGAPTWNVCDASIYRAGRPAPTGQIPAGWFPSSQVATDWLKFINLPQHPLTSLP
jgi:hypothetical protein